ncbi:uncharacterized protein LOC142056873 [Phalacrocorax aristotelis]|uniref:uncharacterized protein LOC142056873 n=1 Tax=Phalacrocorax aristotelis TaxID=126867 RepID=UPI003F4BD683
MAEDGGREGPNLSGPATRWRTAGPLPRPTGSSAAAPRLDHAPEVTCARRRQLPALRYGVSPGSNRDPATGRGGPARRVSRPVPGADGEAGRGVRAVLVLLVPRRCWRHRRRRVAVPTPGEGSSRRPDKERGPEAASAGGHRSRRTCRVRSSSGCSRSVVALVVGAAHGQPQLMDDGSGSSQLLFVVAPAHLQLQGQLQFGFDCGSCSCPANFGFQFV